MTVRLDTGVVRLDGDCAVEDAETLLALLLDQPAAAIDLAQCTRLHLAVVQVLLVAHRPIAAPPGDPFLRDFIVPVLARLPE